MNKKIVKGRPLTDKERRLVEENHNLIYGYANLHNLQITDDINRIYHSCTSHEDWYGALATGLCHAARTWDETKGSFSYWAYLNMDSEVEKVKKAFCIHNPKIIDTLENIEFVARGDNKNRITDSSLDSYLFEHKADAIYGRDEDLDSVEIHILLEEAYKKVGKWGKLCKGALEGDVEISVSAQELGVTRQRGWEKYNKYFLPQLRAELEEALKIH